MEDHDRMPESSIQSDRANISRIVAQMLDAEQISEEDRTWLEQRLREDDRALQDYLRLVDLDARLRWANRSGPSQADVKSQDALKSSISAAISKSDYRQEKSDTPGEVHSGHTTVSPSQRPRTKRADPHRSEMDSSPAQHRRLWAIAGSVAVAMLVLLTVQSRMEPGPGGTLTQSAGAKWAGSPEEIEVGEDLGTGRLTLIEGVAEIALPDDTRLIVEGHSTFELVSPGRVLLERGNLSVFVGPDTTGYTVDTPDARVRDLSTAFQVNVGRDGTEVHVIEGEVVASGTHSPNDQQVNNLHLLYRDAVFFSRTDGSVKPVEFEGEQLKFSGEMPLTAIPRKVSGDIRVLEHPPASVEVGEFEHDDEMYLFLEQSGAIIEKTIYADRNAKGEVADKVGNMNMEVAAGTCVNSYLLHFDPQINSARVPMNRVSGTVTFRTPIIGLFTRGVGLLESDRQLCSPETKYTDQWIGRRSLDAQDFVAFSPDRKTLIVNLQANTTADQIRIVTMNEFQ